jgi:hypothetical protein
MACGGGSADESAGKARTDKGKRINKKKKPANTATKELSQRHTKI